MPASTVVAEPSPLAEPARVYLEEALTVMREHSINRDLIDWDLVEASAFDKAAGAQSATGTYPAIRLALDLLQDEHSLFLSPGEASAFSEGDAVFVTPVVEVRPERVGYVSIGRYLGDVGQDADAYATDLATRIEAARPEVCGWILDLRSNGGGNMWPMLAGLSPLLEQGTVGFFTYPTGQTESWRVTGGASVWGDAVMVDNSLRPSAHLPQPVAVLLSTFTASSGEAIAVAFHGQDGVQFFGQATAGLTTSNELVELSDGALIALTMSNFTDRRGLEYGQGIPVLPDEETADFAASEAAAVEWLLAQPACSQAGG